METAHDSFYNFHQYLLTLQDLYTQVKSQIQIPTMEKGFLYNYTLSPLYLYYTYFSFPSLVELFKNSAFLELALKLEQYHIELMELYEQLGYSDDDEYSHIELPDEIQDYILSTVNDLNSFFHVVDWFQSPDEIARCIKIFETITAEFNFILEFCNQILIIDAAFAHAVEQLNQRLENVKKKDISVTERKDAMTELFKSILLLGIPFIVGYETYARAPRELIDILQFESILIHLYLDNVTQQLTADQKKFIENWFEANKSAEIRIPGKTENMAVIDELFLHSLHYAHKFFYFSQVGQYAQYLQARYRLDLISSGIFLSKYYETQVKSWIDQMNFDEGGLIVKTAIQISTEKFPEMVEPTTPQLTELPPKIQEEIKPPPTPAPKEVKPPESVFAKLANDLNALPSLSEIDRILRILKGER